MAFFQRLMSQMMSDVLIKKLSNSPTFQRFAYKSVTGVRCRCAADGEPFILLPI
jgi:hypothetical protein